MSTPVIPNLKSLGSSRLAASVRGIGASSQPSNAPDGDLEAKDKIVQQTDQDATISRLSAVELGYLSDSFAKDFARDKVQRKLPIINRGTYVRTTAIDSLVQKFIAADPGRTKQIISLGAGSDTRYFRLISSNPGLSLIYHELDFASNTRPKIESVKRLMGPRFPHLTNFTLSEQSTALYSQNYNIHPIDLRTLQDPKESKTAVARLHNVDTSLPTLILSECCLIYLPPTDADAVVRYFSSYLFPPSTPLGFIIYEPINPNDSFGRVMVQNLASRGIVLQTLKKYASLLRQRERLRIMGFRDGQGAADVDFIWETWTSEQEKYRVANLEMLDEVEEWRLLAQHYCVAWGWRDGQADSERGGESIFARWKEGIVAQSIEDQI
ncbi:MAG: hypothetical protein M1825_005714 [Sarcosagium campestre]|nr:MAG: hypothetical protein M1825_005714 [Sarcosagium campestre]